MLGTQFGIHKKPNFHGHVPKCFNIKWTLNTLKRKLNKPNFHDPSPYLKLSLPLPLRNVRKK